jgi:hypothetical protein
MIFTVREKTKKQFSNKAILRELEEKEFEKTPTLNDKIQIGKKYYRVDNIIIASHLKDEKGVMHEENFLDIVLVDKNYENDINVIYRRDRFGHQIFEKKDGGYYTVDKNGKKVREWDKDNELIYGQKYPEIKKDVV